METITKWRAFEWHIIKRVTFIEMPARLTRVTNQAKNVVWKMAAHCWQCAGVHKQLPADGAGYHRVLGPTTRTLLGFCKVQTNSDNKYWYFSLSVKSPIIFDYTPFQDLTNSWSYIVYGCRSTQNFSFARCIQKKIYYPIPFLHLEWKAKLFLFFFQIYWSVSNKQ